MVENNSTNRSRPFREAKPADWFIRLVQSGIRAEFAFTDRVHIAPEELNHLQSIPRGTGVIVTPNHADETDPQICLDLSRRAKRRFIFMGNREAFDEMNGFAGWALQRMGVFSVERGGHDVSAKQYAVDVVRSGMQDLVIFPEGEIFYLNESVQPFHSGAVEIGIKAILAEREKNPAWTAYIVPVAIKYRYGKHIQPILEKRIREMERQLRIDKTGNAMQIRLAAILGKVIGQQELLHNLQHEAGNIEDLSERLKTVRHQMLSEVQARYRDLAATQKHTIDRAWQLSGQLREMVARGVTPERRAQLEDDLRTLGEVAHMVSLHPEYALELDAPSVDRMAEVILKLEREVYKIKRPRALGKRDVYVRIAAPIDLSSYIDEYRHDPHALRHKLSESLRQTVQSQIDTAEMMPARR